MKFLIPLLSLALFAPVHADKVVVPSGIDHDPLDTLLQTYVDDKGLVDYAAWKDSPRDLAKLNTYLAQFAPRPKTPAKGDEQIASLINAYNAFTLKLILDHYPTESIRELDDPFDGEHYRVGGRDVSADEIEHDTLRPIIGWKVHALVVCAARSCPPLHTRAFRADTWEDTMRDRYRVWLARTDLNAYMPGNRRAKVSKIFKWYKEDYKGDHEVEDILGRFGPARHRRFLASGKYKIRYKDYHWGLNDQSDLGKDYTRGFFSIF